MTAVFRSKIDGKLMVLGIVAPCVALFAVANGAQHAVGLLWLPLIATIVVAVVVVWILMSTYYEFENQLIVAHCGPLSWRIPINEISTICESNSARSGPALSMDRLEISFGRGRVLMISPKDKAGFLRELRLRAPRFTP
jgi:Bacterial PH domain